MIQDFQVSITPVGTHQYLVRTERLSAGVPLAEEQVVWPIGKWLQQAQSSMKDPLLGVLSGETLGEDGGNLQLPPALGLLRLGHELYQALFSSSLRDSWVIAQGVAHHRGELLRLRLGLRGEELLRLPWEVMHDGDRSHSGMIYPVTTRANVMFSRYQAKAAMSSSYALPGGLAEEHQVLRVLMVVSSPDDQEQIQLREEVLLLQQELTERSPSSVVKLKVLEQPDRAQLTEELEQGQYHVLHYAGHSNAGRMGGELHLVNRQTGLTELMSGQDLAGLLVNNRVRLVVLNSCRGAYGGSGESADRNLAEVMVGRGVPAVLAMADNIPDHVALTLTQLFYRNLRQGFPIDLSLSRARQGLISSFGSDHLYWALPVLYLHPDYDGQLLVDDPRLPACGWLPDGDDMLPDLSFVPSETENGNAGRASVDLQAESKPSLPSSSVESGFGTEETFETLVDDLPAEEHGATMSELLRHLSNELTTVLEAGEAGAVDDAPLDENESQRLAPADDTPEGVGGGDRSDVVRSLDSPPDLRRAIEGTPRWKHPWVLGVCLSAAIAVAWVQWSAYQRSAGEPSSPNVSSTSAPLEDDVAPAAPAADRGSQANQDVQVAIAAVQQGDVRQAEQAMTQLLDDGNYTAISSVFASLPSDLVNDPTLRFLRGRFLWQSTGASTGAIQEVLPLWQGVVNDVPDAVSYRIALGFAYAEAGDWFKASGEWQRVLDDQSADPVLALAEDAYGGYAQVLPVPSLEDLAGQREMLMVYAGLAIALDALADQDQVDNPEQAQQAARALRDAIMQQSPVDFQMTSLAEEWLWSEEMIQRWQSL